MVILLWSLLGCRLAWAETYVVPMTLERFWNTRIQAYKGDVGAEVEMGDLYYNGGYVHRNLRKAAHWYLAAAQHGDPRAQSLIAEMYEFGEAIAQDHAKALDWIHKSTAQWPAAAVGIALRYQLGLENTTVDLPKAISWWLISAEGGQETAQTELGELYENGAGVQNLTEAVRWYRAAAGSWGPAMIDLGRLYALGKGVPQSYKEAAAWYTKASDRGWLAANYELGLLYEQGLGVTQDAKRAMELYHRSGVNEDAARRLIRLYEATLDLPADPQQILSWYQAHAAVGESRAQVGLGLHYEYGQGVKRSDFVARTLYFLATQHGGDVQDLPDFGAKIVGPDEYRLSLEMAKPGNFQNAIKQGLSGPPNQPIQY